MQRFEFEVDAGCEKKRLDVFLTGAQADVSRSFVQKLIEEGRVQVNAAPAKANYKVKAGDAVVMEVPEPAPLEVEAEAIPLNIVFEDEHLIIIDKPAGMVVHPAPGHSSGTLVHALLHHCRDLKGIGGVERPGIVHRLDKDTSGLIAVAKTATALASLQQQFQERTIRKTYLTLVFGRMPEAGGTIATAISRHPTDRKKMAAGETGREAETVWEVVRHFEGYDLVRCFPKTGRTHQIRVHLASIGHPVLGDALYAGRRRLQTPLPERQALHAHRLELAHPKSKKILTFVSDWPKDLEHWNPS